MQEITSSIKGKYRFLYDYGSPIIKNEAALALGLQNEKSRKEAAACSDVQYWIERLHNFIEKPQVHNADDHCLENSMHKLESFGITEDFDIRIKETNKFILNLLCEDRKKTHWFDSINSTICASWLACMGYDEQIVCDILCERVNSVYEFTKEKNYDIYVSPNGFPAVPASRKTHPLVDPALYENNIWKLPSIHDVFAYSHLPKKLLKDKDIKKKIDVIINYIMDDKYQNLHEGYGLMLVPPNKYYSMGWSVHLSKYKKENPLRLNGLVWNMELMSKFAAARKTQWFKDCFQHLQSYEQNGVYKFPKEYLVEAHKKYYVGGGHMGLGEDKKKKLRLELESTAWMLRIIKNSAAESGVLS